MVYNISVSSKIIMVGVGGMQADVELGKELRALHLDLQATGSELSHWAWLEQT